MFLSNDNLIHSGHQVGNECALFLNALIQFPNVNVFTHKICIYQLVQHRVRTWLDTDTGQIYDYLIVVIG